MVCKHYNTQCVGSFVRKKILHVYQIQKCHTPAIYTQVLFLSTIFHQQYRRLSYYSTVRREKYQYHCTQTLHISSMNLLYLIKDEILKKQFDLIFISTSTIFLYIQNNEKGLFFTQLDLAGLLFNRSSNRACCGACFILKTLSC